MVRKGACPLALFVLLLSSCSWREEFVIFNDSPAPVTIRYAVEDVFSRFPVFDNHPAVYAQTRSGTIDYDKVIAYADADTAKNSVNVILPAHHAMIIGWLSNDHYKGHNQEFINGRVFNLVSIKAQTPNADVSITPANFDDFFKKSAPGVVWRIR